MGWYGGPQANPKQLGVVAICFRIVLVASRTFSGDLLGTVWCGRVDRRTTLELIYALHDRPHAFAGNGGYYYVGPADLY